MKRKTLTATIAETQATALSALGFAGASIEVSLVSDAQIRALNRQHRGKNKATDVLSFPLFEGKNGRLKIARWARGQPLGSVVISRDTARAQAKQMRHRYRDEIIRLLVHGCCHVVGFDHERSASDEKRMFAEEDRILALIRR